jgi:hypothetical protein
MKFKNHFRFLLLFLGFLAFTNAGYAKSVVITGDAYGDQIGVIHFDYKTAKNPNPADPTLNAAKYYVGPTKQFYLSPYDSYSLDPAHPFTPGFSNFVSQISTDSGDCAGDSCYLKGFAWSDKIGWIALDGKSAIGPSIIENGGTFPENFYPKIKTNPDSNNRLAITGFAWNEYTGWIMLSSDSTGNTGITLDPASQTSSDWGVWLDGSVDPDRIEVTDPTDSSIKNSIKLGRHLNGYAWSEKLGWIKFSKTASDSIDFTAYTLWMPDKTPPIRLAPDKLWFAAGVNTHYPDVTKVPQNIFWDEFAVDPESGIDTATSKITITPLNGCPTPPAIGKKTNILTSYYDYSTVGNGDILGLIIPGMATVKNVPGGFCKYKVSAEIWNDVNNVIYIGDSLPSYLPADTQISPAITVYVRAGDYADNAANPTGNVEVASTNPLHLNAPEAYADGKEAIKYTVNFSDIAGNPIIDVDCNTPSGSYYEYDGCPGRKAVVTANVTNRLLYDLTQSDSTQIIRPVLHGDGSPSSYTAFTENDNDIGYWPNASTQTLSWPVNKYSGGKTNIWDVQINKSGYVYPLFLTSFSPSGTFTLASGATFTPPLTYTADFQVNSFNYKTYNEKLPETSKKLHLPLPALTTPPTLPTFETENTSKVIMACYDDGNMTDIPSCANPNFSTLPAPSSIPRAATTGLIFNTLGTSNKKAVFDPPIVNENGSLTGEIGANILTMSSPAQLSFVIHNVSSSDLTVANNSGFSVDNIFQFYGSASAALMDTQRISNETSGETDPWLGWSDPFEFCPDCTRYEMYMNGGKNYGTPMSAIEPKNSPFVNFFEHSPTHPGSKFYFNDDASNNTVLSSEVAAKAPSNFIANNLSNFPPNYLTNEIGDDGRYAVSGLASIPVSVTPTNPSGSLTDPFNYTPGYIDRSDAVNWDMPAGGKKTKTIQFYPEKLISVTLSTLKFQLMQEIAYRFPTQQIYTVYPLKVPGLDNIETKDVGLEAKGTVSGSQIVTGREFDVVGTASTQKLQEQVRRNVAEMTAGINTANCTIPTVAITEFNTTAGNCVIQDTVNGTVFAYYKGDENSILTLGNGTSDLTVPNMPYTIVVEGGANVFIKSNIVYSPANTKSSFGIIVIAGDAGPNNQILGANIYVSPVPTNISAVAYVEGSIVSRSDSGNLYYGGSSEDIKELKNQLYWRGSIASRNTIAGAGVQKIPVGVSCNDGGTIFSCAQRYDLDYLRRFTVIIDKTTFASKIGNDGKFSGGGSCNSSTGICSLGSLPTVIKLDSSGHILEATSEISTVYVEKDSNTTNNPPPGFTLTTGLETNQEIR